MKVTMIAHASILVETGGVRILSDPWWAGPCFGSQWWLDPPPFLEPIEAAPPDFIYISHGHADHLHNGTLSRFPRTVTCLVSDELDVADPLRRLGFEVLEIPRRTPREIAPGVTVELMATHGGDSLMVVSDGSESCANLNDALHAAPDAVQAETVAYLRDRYGTIDYAFCGYGIASYFPNCIDVPGMDRAATAAARQRHFNGQWAKIMHGLRPRFAFPFAADVVLLQDELFWANEPVHNSERPTDHFAAAYPDDPSVPVDIAPGYAIENGVAVSDVRFRPVSGAHLRERFADKFATANGGTVPTAEALDDICERLRANVDLCRAYLGEWRGDYAFLIVLTGAPTGIEIVRKGARWTVAPVASDPARHGDYDVVFETRYAYLRRALSVPYGHEVIFVGSGGIFRYRDRGAADRNLHQELAILLRLNDSPPRSRYGDQPKWLYDVKRAVKAVLGRSESDLYDLRTWARYG